MRSGNNKLNRILAVALCAATLTGGFLPTVSVEAAVRSGQHSEVRQGRGDNQQHKRPDSGNKAGHTAPAQKNNKNRQPDRQMQDKHRDEQNRHQEQQCKEHEQRQEQEKHRQEEMKRQEQHRREQEQHRKEQEHKRQEQEKRRAAQDLAARLRGQMEEIGTREQLAAEHARLKAQMEELLKRYRAIALAEEVIGDESEKLRAKISPEITSRAAGYLSFLTDDRYQEIRVDERLRASTGVGDGRMLDEQRLSSGTRDQLYLALRLAVCDTLEQTRSVPLILDDPFITSDDARTERGIELLRRLGHQRQIILLTCRKS